MEKLIAVVMGQDCERTIKMALESVKDADTVVYIDGGSNDKTLDIIKKSNCKLLQHTYNKNDIGMNGKQRNFYLDWLKKFHLNEWCLVIDADEVVEDLQNIKDFINEIPEDNNDVLFSIKMRHFIGDLGHEDTTQQIHFVPHRLFKVREELIYPEVEHPVLTTKTSDMRSANIMPTTIWHLAYIPNMWDIKRRYENHLEKSDIHTPEYLRNWYYAHLFGLYPKRQFDMKEIPEVILNNFGIDKDEFYFANRSLEVKHFLMMDDWYEYFKPKTILDIGCGLGHYGYVAKKIFGCDYLGIDKSKWAIENTPHKELDIIEGTLPTSLRLPDSNYDLVLLVDIMEHLEEKDLDWSLDIVSQLGKNFIFSIPFLGDPNLDADKTHKIKKSKEWWIEKLSEHFKITQTPEDWLYSKQILIGERK